MCNIRDDIAEPRQPPAPANRAGDCNKADASQYTTLTPYVYHRCMTRVRTNIEIEDTYVQLIMDRYKVRTKTEAVELALRHLAGQPMSRHEALAMRGVHAIVESPADVQPRA